MSNNNRLRLAYEEVREEEDINTAKVPVANTVLDDIVFRVEGWSMGVGVRQREDSQPRN